MRARALILTLGLGLGLASLASAQERSVSLDAPLEAMLGDPISLILTVTGAPTDEAAVPEQALAPFEILGKDVTVSTDADGSAKTFAFELTLLCFEVGQHTLGPVRVRMTSAEGELIELESNAAEIEVTSVLANEPNPELKPPTEPIVVEQDDYRLWIALGALAALALGALLAWLLMRWWQRRERPEPTPPPPPPPWEVALSELGELREQRQAELAEGRTEPWVDAVSDSVRSYLGRRYGFHGLESTTDEIAAQLGRAKSLVLEPQEAVVFLGRCDLVKFAKASLAEDASRELIEDAIAMVERTKPVERADDGGTA